MNRKQAFVQIAVVLAALLLFLLPVSALMEEGNQNNTRTIYDAIIDDDKSDIYQTQDEHEFVFIWLNGDGSELARQSFADSGASPSLSPTPVKADDDTYSYTFSGWDTRPREVNGVSYKIYVPQFTSTPIVRHKLTIHYQYAGGGQASADYTADIKENANYSVDSPKIDRFTVDPETVSGIMGTQDIETTVTYTAYTPTIRFLDELDNVLQSGQVAWDTMPVYGGPTPTKDSTPEHTYAFAGWDPAIEAVTRDQDYTTIFTESPREYTIRFLNADGTVLQSGSVAWGATPAYTGNTPEQTATAQYTYAFNAWTPAIKAVDGDQDYTATFNQSLRGYTIRFLNADGAVLKKETLAFGSTPGYTGDIPTQAATAQYTFNFQGWTPAIKAVEGDADYTAVYAESLNSYTVRFLNADGAELQKETLSFGATPAYAGETPQKAGTAQYTYTFTGWAPEIAPVSAEATYTAQFAESVKEYTVRFLDDDGTELQKETLSFGATPAYAGNQPQKEATAKFTYAFNRWTPEIAAVSADADYTAAFTETLNSYTVRFLDEDGTVLQSASVPYGETPAYTGETPVKTGTAQYSYAFAGWTPTLAAVSGDAAYTAVYTQTLNHYTVRFLDEDESLLQTADYAYGDTPSYTGKALSKPDTAQYSYAFSNWNPEIATVEQDAEYIASYMETVNQYTVSFLDEDGKVLQTASVPYGETPAYTGKAPEKAGTAQYTYTFAGWTPAITAVSGDAAYSAAFTTSVNSYTVTFLDEDSKDLQTASVPYGETPAYTGKTPEKAGTAQYTYAFAGWTPAITTVSGDATYTATFTQTLNSYTVTFLNEDGAELQSGLVPWGETPAYTGETPQKAATERYAYDFTGWTPAITTVSGEATYTAVYSDTLLLYPITFRNEDATVLQRGEVRLGETPAYTGETPTKEPTENLTYTFSGWTPALAPVSGKATYTAFFTAAPRTYTVQFVNDDGTVLQSEELAWGETPVYHGETPTKESTAQYEFTFSGWNPAAFSPVSGDATYTAEYTETVRTYTIRFIYEDGVVHETLQLKYGDYPLCKEDPYRNGTRDYEVRPVRTLVTEDFDYTLHCVADDVDFDPLTNKTDKDLGKSGIENLFWGQVDSDHQQITLTDGDPKSGIPGVGLSNNPDGSSSLPNGSTVQLQWIEKPESTLQSLKESGKIRSETLNFFYDDLDDGQKLWLFQLNAYDPSGKKLEQNDFQSTMEVYLELGDDWDIEDINAIYLENDEILEKPEIVYKNVNGVMKRFAVLRMKHFSTYAVILRGTFGSNPQQEQY